MQRQPSFLLTSEQCEILLHFKETGSVQRLAKVLGRDISAVSRQLQRIAAQGDLLEKHLGRWRVSRLGDEIVEWTRDSILEQRKILNARAEIRVVTTREFAARVLAPKLRELIDPNSHFILSAAEEGVEHWLLSARADIGLDCGAPRDPLIAYRALQPEPFSIVLTPDLRARLRLSRTRQWNPALAAQMIKAPHLRYLRINTKSALKLNDEIENVVATFNDIASLRSACCQGLGWAILPSYTVRDEIERDDLSEIILSDGPSAEKFGVWWLRGRKSIQPQVDKLILWLKTQNLGSA